MSNKNIKAGILIITLGIPAFVFLFLKFFGKNKFDLPYYFPKINEMGEVIIVKGDTVFNQVPKFILKNQDGQKYVFDKDSSQVKVVNFFFSRCGTICPVTNKNINRLSEKFKDKSVKFVSISVDPKYDQAEILKAYKNKFLYKNKNWDLLTGDKKYIYELAIGGFKLPVSDASEYDKNIENIDETFIHSEKFLLIDDQGYIRGIYDGTSTSDIDRLVVETKVLLTHN
ncbi:MAG: SCO family protein [Cytophagaceae bacterium]|nr:SCO family protein [Cytophagaceae bacterium]MBK9509383.1 SCO family protein [Cytophagaceae bacterium]MBK9935192.1 SCO family protein [Cytophagaceae bacterium]MBL0301635.1 SCO family protein [Cytophagaceae bacterium]MBL0324460.1 SCO family protein [Cytophagaceae bacterium]